MALNQREFDKALWQTLTPTPLPRGEGLDSAFYRDSPSLMLGEEAGGHRTDV